jgi:membrane fusion protein (multidrug efflux system)
MSKSYKNTLTGHSVVLSLIGCLLAGGCGQGNGSQTNRGEAGKTAIPVEAQVIMPQSLESNIQATGTLLANEEVELRSEISGRVTGVFFEEGKRVKQGELLLKINDRELKAQLTRKEVEEKQASNEELRQRRLFETQGISQENYDKFINALSMIRAEKEAIESQLAQTEVRAPFDGVIGLRYVSEGGYVTPNVLVATMQDINVMKVEFSVPERYAGQIKTGTEIMVRAGESPDAYKGTVYAVESKIDLNTRTIKSRARIPNPGAVLIPGAFARVEITLEKVPDAIVIPSGALIPELTGQKVYVCRNGQARSVPVKTGIRNETGIQITEGLTANDTLIVTGLLQIADGKAVRITTLKSN